MYYFILSYILLSNLIHLLVSFIYFVFLFLHHIFSDCFFFTLISSSMISVSCLFNFISACCYSDVIACFVFRSFSQYLEYSLFILSGCFSASPSIFLIWCFIWTFFVFCSIILFNSYSLLMFDGICSAILLALLFFFIILILSFRCSVSLISVDWLKSFLKVAFRVLIW